MIPPDAFFYPNQMGRIILFSMEEVMGKNGGFIRAEVIHWDQLLAAQTYAEARKRGQLRSEGKAYLVQDGDVLNILFNV
jgi:hypothetical protein